MAAEIFSNNAYTTVVSGGTTAPAAGTTETWTVTSSASFPAASSSATPPTWFHVADPAAQSEIITVTSVSGTTWTVTRGAESTTPVAHASGFPVYQVASAGALTQLRSTAWVNAVTQFGAVAFEDSTTAIQNALLSFGTLTAWSQGQGGIVYLPRGLYLTSRTLIIPSGVRLIGDGWATQLTLTANSGCDMIQTATYNSSSQAAILGVPAGSIINAFYPAVESIALHGDAFSATAAAYCHGINITTNPALAAAPADPDFDPDTTIRDVWIKACTGDGIYQSGRGGALFERILVQYNNGNGFTPSFDSTMVDCLAESCCTGFYFSHQSQAGAGCKSFNNKDLTWVSGHAYSVGNVAVSASIMYFCVSAVTSSTAPASDPAHWTALSATSPAATGYGYYWDTNCGEHSWAAIDSQQNSKGDYYFKNTQGAITVQGSSSQVNFNNGQPAYNAANPNSYASVTLDGTTGGVTAVIGSSQQSAGHGVICNGLNSPSRCTLIAATDGTETTVLAGTSPAYALVNGKTLVGAFSAGIFGDGSSGAVTLNGSNTYGFANLSGSTYTLKADILATSLTVNSGITVKAGPFRIFCTGTITNAGVIDNSGTSAASSTGATMTSSNPGVLGLGAAGGNGNTGNGSTGSGDSTGTGFGCFGGTAGNGGAGGTGSAGGKGFSTNGSTFMWRSGGAPLFAGMLYFSGVRYGINGGAGGGGGGGDGANAGGGGGSGAGIIAIFAPAVVNTGTISANGGNGFTPVAGNAGGGGPGGGGLILVFTLTAWTAGTTSVAAGTAGSGAGSGAAGGTGNAGLVVNVILQ